MSQIVQKQVTILNAQSLSQQVDIGPLTLSAIVMPAGWSAAGLSLQASYDGGTTWVEVADKAAPLAIAAAAGQVIALDAYLTRGIVSFKIRSGTSGVPVNQGADRILTLVCVQI